MDFAQELVVGHGDDLVKLRHGLKILAMLLGGLIARLKLKTAHYIKDGILGEHHFEQSIFVEEEYVPEYLVKVMQTLGVLQVLADVENVEQFLG